MGTVTNGNGRGTADQIGTGIDRDIVANLNALRLIDSDCLSKDEPLAAHAQKGSDKLAAQPVDRSVRRPPTDEWI